MALNYSRRPVFSVPENNLVSSLRRNGCFVDESNENGFSGNPWLSNQRSFDFGRESSQESASVDIIDLLPADPFGMDISTMDIGTKVTAINGWLEDLDFGYSNGCERDCGGESTLLAGFNLFWNSAMRFRTFSGDVGEFGDNTCNGAQGGVSGCLGEVSTLSNVGFGYCGGEGSANCGSSIGNCVGDQNEELPGSSDGGCDDVDDGTPHPALIFSLGFLGLQDLLSCEMVCRTFRSTIVNDPLLWRSIHVDQPLNEKITDDVLLRLVSRAQGNLQSLTLVECPRVTDDGFKLILQSNLRLTKLSVPGCTRLSIEGIVSSLTTSRSMGASRLEQLRVGGIYGVTPQHFEVLKSFLNVDDDVPRDREPPFYRRGGTYLSGDDDRAIDVEICPKCEKVRLVYDCPADGCQVTENSNQTCRACVLCIPRCAQCGRCIYGSEYEETFCLEWLCSCCGVKFLRQA